ncbi:AzlC family ABC transporter permease, partial [Mesorhizobium sp. B264B2A]|uniref:AzlC family ABC transporter permease n=1 Tax=Mesorhizobium sp. B264B2A TaxID=2876666 RepID=UPI001CCC9751
MSIAETRSAAGGGLNSEFRRGVASCAPVLFGTIPYALVLGAQATQRGLSTAELSLLTGLNFAGGSEFAAIQLWTSPPHVLLIAAVTFLVNSRHLLMGAALAPFLRDLPRRKVFSALFFMCDESWALGLADAKRRAPPRHPGGGRGGVGVARAEQHREQRQQHGDHQRDVA